MHIPGSRLRVRCRFPPGYGSGSASALAAATSEEQLPLTATGWADTTRIAAGDPELWQQILLGNRQHVLAALTQFESLLGQMRQAVTAEDASKLKDLLAEGKRRRDAVGN